MFRHDPAHTGYSASSVPANPLLIWTFPNPNITARAVITTPVVSEGFLYINGANGGGFYCLNASTGTLIWKFLTISPSDLYATFNNMIASPTVANGNIYIGTNEGNVLAFGNMSNAITTPSPSTPLSDLQLTVIVAVVVIVILAVLFLVYGIRRKGAKSPPRA